MVCARSQRTRPSLADPAHSCRRPVVDQLARLAAGGDSERHGTRFLQGVVVLFGTYFLSVLGPEIARVGGQRAVALPDLATRSRKPAESQGPALGLALLYGPSGWLFALHAIYLFPGSWWKIVLKLLSAGCSLLTAWRKKQSRSPRSTSEHSKAKLRRTPAGRRWAVQLGTLTFSIGVITGRWALAIDIGIVYSTMTAAAMAWQKLPRSSSFSVRPLVGETRRRSRQPLDACDDCDQHPR